MKRPDTLVLCYHAVSETWESQLAVTPEALAAQTTLLADRGYAGITFTDAALGGGDGKRVAVTFDDAYDSVFTLAMPILDELGFPGTVFVPTAFPSRPKVEMAWPGIEQWRGTPDGPELLPMSWDHIRKLRESGWEIGSHTVSHPRLTSLNDGDLTCELTESRQTIEGELDEPCRSIAFPYGDTDERVREAARNAGYNCAAALPGDAWSPSSATNFPRVGVYRGNGDRAFKGKVSPMLRRIRSSRAWPAIAGFVRRRRPD